MLGVRKQSLLLFMKLQSLLIDTISLLKPVISLYKWIFF